MPISEVTCEDNMIMMSRFPDKFFDLAIIDPQTGQGEDKKHSTRPNYVKQKNGNRLKINCSHKIKDWDSAPPDQFYFDELFRVSKHQIIMCENFLQFEQKKTSHGRIIWNLLRDNDFSSCQIMWTSLINKIDYFEYLWNGMFQGEKINSRTQIGDKTKNEDKIHPSQKPRKVYRHLLKEYVKNGHKILDTHNGSGSLRIECFCLGFDFWGVESDPDYFRDGNIRFERECHGIIESDGIKIKQQTLF
jgi:site-specific DNA-methyltransferase (adenine-specific)